MHSNDISKHPKFQNLLDAEKHEILVFSEFLRQVGANHFGGRMKLSEPWYSYAVGTLSAQDIILDADHPQGARSNITTT